MKVPGRCSCGHAEGSLGCRLYHLQPGNQSILLSAPAPQGDRPRKVVICSKANYPQIQQGVTAMGHGDVLVRPTDLVEDDRCFVIDGGLLDDLFG